MCEAGGAGTLGLLGQGRAEDTLRASAVPGAPSCPAAPGFFTPSGSLKSLPATADPQTSVSRRLLREKPYLLIFSTNVSYNLGILSDRVHRVITERMAHYLHISYLKGYLCNY